MSEISAGLNDDCGPKWSNVYGTSYNCLTSMYPYALLYHPRTLTTFRFPFCIPPDAPGVGPAPGIGLSVAFIPALTVSMSTPVEIAGEYCEIRLDRGGRGSGGTGTRRLPVCLGCGAAGDLDFVCAGCLPLLELIGLGGGGTAAGFDGV